MHSKTPLHFDAGPSSPPPKLFFSTPGQRITLARERFFEEGVRPTGLVPDAVIQSWTRCVQAHQHPGERISFNPVTRSRISATLARSRALLDAAADDLGQLEATLAGTSCKAILTDRHGVVVHATRSEPKDGALMLLAGRVGVELAEEQVGTTAPGMVIKTGQLCSVYGAQHFYNVTQVMYCAAAPICDRHGQLVGVLDLSCESRPFRFDAAGMAHMVATAIENRLLCAQATQHLVLRFQASPALLNTPLEGLAAIDGDGCVAWINSAGAGLLGAGHERGSGLTAESAFGLGLAHLLDAAHGGGVIAHRVPNGLTLFLCARLQAADGRWRGSPAALNASAQITVPVTVSPSRRESPASAAVAAVATASAGAPERTLQCANRDLIARTLEACKGNVARAARELGVSRGLIYRRLARNRPG